MDLLEYQVKHLFRQTGIPVLPSQCVYYPQDLKFLRIPYPVVLKSQVPVGGRGRAGGVRFAENTIDAVAAAQAIFRLPIRGEYPDMLLAEAKYDAEREFYLAVVLDRAARRPVLLGSMQGGVDADLAAEQIQQVVVAEKFSPFYARRLVLKMGLRGELIKSVSAVVEKMYRLFVNYDLDSIEINPLGIQSNGDVMALDGKASVNDDAIDRHRDLLDLGENRNGKGRSRSLPALPNPNFAELDGDIAIICNGGGLTLATLDLVSQAGGKPASFTNLGGEGRWDATPQRAAEALQQAIERVVRSSRTRVVLVNLLGQAASPEAIDVLASHAATTSNRPRLVVRLDGAEVETMERLAEAGIVPAASLDEAVEAAIALKV